MYVYSCCVWMKRFWVTEEVDLHGLVWDIYRRDPHFGSTAVITPSQTSTWQYRAVLTTLMLHLHLSTQGVLASTHCTALFMTVGVVVQVMARLLHQVKSRRGGWQTAVAPRSLLFDWLSSFIIWKPSLMLLANRLTKPLESLPVAPDGSATHSTCKCLILEIIFKYNDWWNRSSVLYVCSIQLHVTFIENKYSPQKNWRRPGYCFNWGQGRLLKHNLSMWLFLLSLFVNTLSQQQ